MKKEIIKSFLVCGLFVLIMGCSVENKGKTAATGSPREETPLATVATEAAEAAEAQPPAYDEWFSISEISDDVFNRIKGVSYKSDCTVPLEDLRYLTVAHYTLDGDVKKGELICNRLIAEDLIDIFRNLFNARYPIESIRLVDDFDADDRKSMSANNTSCFNYRVVAGSTKLSNHARGLAVDINPRYNPYVRKQKNGKLLISPANGEKYADRKADYPYKIDENDLCYKEFVAHGFNWGGNWKTMKDYQHFEKKIPGLNY